MHATRQTISHEVSQFVFLPLNRLSFFACACKNVLLRRWFWTLKCKRMNVAWLSLSQNTLNFQNASLLMMLFHHTTLGPSKAGPGAGGDKLP